MTDSPRPPRKRPRRKPEDVRVWVGSVDFEQRDTVANFATRLLDVGLDGMSLETTGRLRPGVNLKVELRFDSLSASLRSDARVVRVDTRKEGAAEVHTAELQFVGTPEITKAVREYLRGEDPELIRARREIAFVELKKKNEREGGPKKRSLLKKLIAVVLVLGVLYLGSYWGFVLNGRVESTEPGIAYRYLGPDSRGGGAERTLEKIYDPAFRLFRACGIGLRYLEAVGPEE